MLPLINSSYFKDLLESFGYGVVILNAKLEAYAANANASGLLGLDLEDILGRGPKQLFENLEGLELLEEMLEYCLETGTAPNEPVDTILKLGNGSVRHLSLAASLLIENGKIFGILISMHDVTRIYQLHEREKRAMEQNTRLQQERAESLLQLSRAMAHQIRNPIMGIGGFSKILQRKLAKDETLSEFATAILENSQRLERMVGSFTEFTGIQPGPAAPIHAPSLVRGAVERGRAQAQDLEIQCEWDAECPDFEIRAAPIMLDKVMDMLIRNALESCSQNGGAPASPCAPSMPGSEKRNCESRSRTTGPASPRTPCPSSSTRSSAPGPCRWAWGCVRPSVLSRNSGGGWNSATPAQTACWPP